MANKTLGWVLGALGVLFLLFGNTTITGNVIGPSKLTPVLGIAGIVLVFIAVMMLKD